MLSEKGSLKETPAIKLLLTIFEQGLTGILYIKREDILKVLYFNRGKMIWAISNSDVDKLENILVAKDLVNPETMQQVKKQSRVSDSIGKLLVEKGLITLEELIDSTKEQLRRIIVSVLKWKDGGFQFIKDAPPERLLSLDLDITQFIVDYIVEEVDLSEIWKTIGSLQVEFIKNPNEQKISKYHLSDKQIELLNGFDGEKKLEAILSRHSGGHRESLLKIIYFFLMAELLIKKEFELADLSVFEEGKGFDYFGSGKEGKGTAKADNPEKKVPHLLHEKAMPVEEPFDTFSDLKDFESNDSFNLVKPVETGELSDSLEPKELIKNKFSTNKNSMRESSYVFSEQETNKVNAKKSSPLVPQIKEPQEEKKRKKFFNVTLIMVFLSLVIGGVIFILLGLLKGTEDLKTLPESNNKVGIKDIITFEEKNKPSVNEGDTGTGNEVVTPQEEGGEPQTQTNIETPQGDKENNDKIETPIKSEKKEESQKNSEKTQSDKEVVSEKNEKPSPQKKHEESTNNNTGKSANDYFHEKSFITAADVWKRELIKNGIKFSVLLEMDCLKDSVIHAYDRVGNKTDFFILLRNVGNKTCYLVMLGKYRTYEQATEGIKSVPSYFWEQKDPPEIVEISKYL